MSSVEIVMYPDGRLDTKNASAYVGKSPKTMAMMRCAGTGPRFIKRGRVFYFREDLDAWLAEAQRVSSTAQARIGTELPTRADRSCECINPVNSGPGPKKDKRRNQPDRLRSRS